jgi:YVTN family beta-propeller protein
MPAETRIVSSLKRRVVRAAVALTVTATMWVAAADQVAAAGTAWSRFSDARIGVSIRYPPGWGVADATPDGSLILANAGQALSEQPRSHLAAGAAYVIIYDQGSVAAAPRIYGALPKRPLQIVLDRAHLGSYEGFLAAYRFSFQEGGRPILIFVKLGANVSQSTREQIEESLDSLRFVPLSAREQTIKLPGAPSDVAYGDGSIWVTAEGPAALRGALLRLDPVRSRVLVRIPLPGVTDYSQIAVGAGAVWVSDSGKSNVYRVDPRTDRVVATVHVGGSPVNIAASASAVWVDDDSSGRLDKINPTTNRLVARIKLPDSTGPLAVAGGSLWVIDTLDDRGQSLLRINPASDRITEHVPLYKDATSVKAIAASGSYLWLGDRRFLVTQINTSSGSKIATLVAGGNAIGAYGPVAFSIGPATAASTKGIAMQLDANHREGAPTYPVGHVAVAVAVGPTAAWVANFEDATLTRIAYHRR